MTLQFYMDQHVPAAVTSGLQRRGIDVLTPESDGTTAFADELLLQRATELGRVVYTQDDDFLAIGHRWQQSDRPFGGIVYAHQLRITIGQAIRDLELIAEAMTADEMANRIEFLPFS